MIRRKLAIRVPTVGDWEHVVSILLKLGNRWIGDSDEDPLNVKLWDCYRENTVLLILTVGSSKHVIVYGNVEYYHHYWDKRLTKRRPPLMSVAEFDLYIENRGKPKKQRKSKFAIETYSERVDRVRGEYVEMYRKFIEMLSKS